MKAKNAEGKMFVLPQTNYKEACSGSNTENNTNKMSKYFGLSKSYVIERVNALY